MIKLLFYTLIVCVLTIESVCGKNLFVSPVGSNTNNGSINFSFKTIQYAMEQAKEFDTIFLRKGLYNESVTINSKKNITIVSYQNEEVTISPFLLNENITWEKYTDNIYKTKINGLALQLFLNNNPIMQASYPNMKEELFNSENAANITVSSKKTINFPGISQFGTLKTGYFLGLCSDNIVSIGGNIVNSSGDQLSITDTAFYWKSEFENSYLGKGKGYLIGNIAFLDTPNEWYADGEYLYVYTSNMKDLDEISIRNKLHAFQILNSEHIKLSNLKIFGGSILVQESSKCTISNLNIEYPVPFHNPWSGFERFAQYWNGVEVLTCGPETWTGKGVEIGGENNQLINCHIAHSWGDGATIYGIGNTIENCIIEDCDWIANDCSVLNISGANHIISNNTLTNSARSILLNRKLYNSKIIHNDLSHGGTKCTDLGLIYNYDTDGKNTEIAYNFIHDSQSKKNGVGIYIDENNQNHSLHHNIITNCSVGINLNKPCKKTSVYNNTLYKNEFSMGAWGSGKLDTVHTFNNITDTDKKLSWNYNAFYGTEMDSNYVYFEDNIFQDPQNDNFQLRKYSYPIDKGIRSEFTNDFNGKLPDLGAIESGSTPWKYGSDLIIPNEEHYSPKAPIKLKLIANTPDTNLFSWAYPYGMVDTFYIERRISTDSFKIIQKLAANQLEFNDSMLPPGEYRYQIRAKNQYGISEPSNSIEVFVPKYDNSLFLDAENNDLQFGNSIAGDIVINSDHSDWICYKEIDFGIGIYDACLLNMAVPCEQAWQEVQIRIDRPMGRMIGNLITTNTGGWDKFEYRTIPIEKTTGKHDVYIRFEGEQGIGTFDWFNLFDSKGTVIESLPNANKCPKPKNPSRIIAVTIFPNPSSEEVSVSVENIEESIISIRLISTQGKTLLTMIEKNQLPGTQEFYLHDKMNISNLEKGLYFVEVTITGKRVIQSKSYKFMKN